MCVAACWLCRICCLEFLFFVGHLSLCGGRALANWVLTVASLRGCSCWGSCPFVVVTERQAAGVGGWGLDPQAWGPQPWQSLPSLPLSLGAPSPPWGALEPLIEGVQSGWVSTSLPKSKLFFIFSSYPSFWVLRAPRSYGAASFVPIKPGAGPFPCVGAPMGRDCQSQGSLKSCPPVCPGRGMGTPAHGLPTTSRSALLPGFLLSEPCECVCLLKSKLKKEKRKKKLQTNI